MLCCPALQTRLEIAAVDELRALLDISDEEGEEFQDRHVLDADDLGKLVAAYAVAFDPSPLENYHVVLRRPHFIDDAPYLIHTNYELLLLLDGRKKLARMGDPFPPTKFMGEERFDHWVERGLLSREEEVELFEKPRKHWLGVRTVYYTLKGEEWRIPAMKLLKNAAARSGGWNVHFERLEGMLFGYEDWQNDWWLEHLRHRRSRNTA